MNQTITYGVSRNMKAVNAQGRDCRIALVLVAFPDGTVHKHCIDEGLLATVPPDKQDDFIASEVEALVGYEVTRQ